MGLQHEIKMKQFFKVKKPIEKKDMNWSQAKWKYPKFKAKGDWDKDGVKNQFDCKPFDRKRQDDSKWKEKMIEDFPTVGDLKYFVKGEGKKEKENND